MKSEVAQDRIVESVEIDAPRERVWRALTDAAQIPRWWGEEGAYQVVRWDVDLRAGGAWHCEIKHPNGDRAEMDGQYLEVKAPEKLVYTWKPYWIECPETRVEWTLAERAGKTVVTVTHTGFAGFAEARKSHTEGWPSIMGWLREYAESAGGDR